MKLICPECGNEMPEGSEFCEKCGAMCKKVIRVDDAGKMDCNYCQKCGRLLEEGDVFCPGCGAPVNAQHVVMRRENIGRKGIAAIILSVVGGILDVYGLGQLVLKRWSKAFMYICLTLLFFYLAPSFDANYGTRMFLMMVRLIVFFFQMLDVFRAVYLVEGSQ